MYVYERMHEAEGVGDSYCHSWCCSLVFFVFLTFFLSYVHTSTYMWIPRFKFISIDSTEKFLFNLIFFVQLHLKTVLSTYAL